MNIEEIKNLKKEILILEEEKNLNIFLNIEDTELLIYNSKKTKTFKLPKNFDFKWIINKINVFEVTSFNNLSNIFKNLNLNGITYYTSYGIGYNCLFSNEEKFKNDVDNIEKHLNNLNIKFKTQFSDHRYCLRFIISQSEENLDIIKKL